MVTVKDLTPEQKKDICNGCGGKGGWIKPPHAKLFRDDCNEHDLLYYIGHTWWDRMKADWKLRKDIRTRIKNTNIVSLRDHLYITDKFIPDIGIRQIYYRWADLYCIGVIAAGWKYFNFATTPNKI